MSSDVIETVLTSGAAGKEQAEQQLRVAITNGEFAPGQRLVESELGENYQVTRNSVRLALDALVADGLVERIPNRGARVRKVTASEAVAIMECRMVLDGLLSRKAAENATSADLEELQAHGRSMAAAVTAGELARYSKLIQDHHVLVSRIARHSAATTLIGRLQAQIVRNQYQLSLRPGRAQESLRELQAVIAAIVARDPAGAEAAARDHLLHVIKTVTEEEAPAA